VESKRALHAFEEKSLSVVQQDQNISFLLCYLDEDDDGYPEKSELFTEFAFKNKGKFNYYSYNMVEVDSDFRLALFGELPYQGP
jgi:hypothetical protein